jgi:inositol oxygenase
MVHAPEVTDYVKQSANKMDAVSDDIDQVNVIKGKKGTYEDESEFDAAKDKTGFRQYEDACDRVKNFYAVSLDYSCGGYPSTVADWP